MTKGTTPISVGKLVNRDEIAARYSVSLRTITNWEQRRILPYIKIGRLVRFDTERCDRALATFEIKSAHTGPEIIRTQNIPPSKIVEAHTDQQPGRECR